MIKGIGTDIVALDRFKANKDQLATKILAEEELSVYRSLKGSNQLNYLAGRFAGKEAFLKADGKGIFAIPWQEIIILNDETGKPYLNFSDCHISITHEKAYAVAFVIIEEKET